MRDVERLCPLRLGKGPSTGGGAGGLSSAANGGVDEEDDEEGGWGRWRGGWMGGGGEVSIRVCAWRCFEMAVGWLLGCLAGMCKARWEKGGERGERGLCGYMLIV